MSCGGVPVGMELDVFLVAAGLWGLVCLDGAGWLGGLVAVGVHVRCSDGQCRQFWCMMLYGAVAVGF